jgi:hypothetical protein
MHNAAFDLAVAEVIVPRPQPDPLPVVVEPITARDWTTPAEITDANK